MDKLLTAAEVAEILGCSKQLVYLLADRREIASYKLGHLRRFAIEDVRAWAEANRHDRQLAG